MSLRFVSYRSAGALYKLLGLLALFAGAAVACVMFGTPVIAGRGLDPRTLPFFALCVGATLGATAALRFLGGSIEKHHGWARIGGVLVAIAGLPVFPVGTLFGAYLLWCLVGGWKPEIEVGEAAPLDEHPRRLQNETVMWVSGALLLGVLAPLTAYMFDNIPKEYCATTPIGGMMILSASVVGLVGPVVVARTARIPLAALAVIPTIGFWIYVFS